MNWKNLVFNALTASSPSKTQLSFERFIVQYVSKNITFQHPAGKSIGIVDFIEYAQFWKRLFPKITRTNIKIQGDGNIITCDWIAKASRFGKIRNKQVPSFLPFKYKKIKTLLKDPLSSVCFNVHAEFTFDKNKLIHLVICPDLKAIIDNTGLSIEALLQKEAAYFHYDRDSLFDILQTTTEPPLSKREVECLALLFSGFSAKQTATHMKLGLKTVETYLSQCYFKLKCNGKCESLELMQNSRILYLWHELCRYLLKKDSPSDQK